ncbi:MAG: hypothetical protein WAK95_03380 [Desulfobacterales bacterium]
MKKLIISVVLIGWVICGAALTFGEMNVAKDPAAFYANCIDKKITCCDRKGDLWDSRSQNLRGCSRMAILKAIYLSANKDRLVRELEANGTALNRHRVDYYLNKQFQESLNATFLTAIWLDNSGNQ